VAKLKKFYAKCNKAFAFFTGKFPIIVACVYLCAILQYLTCIVISGEISYGYIFPISWHLH